MNSIVQTSSNNTQQTSRTEEPYNNKTQEQNMNQNIYRRK